LSWIANPEIWIALITEAFDLRLPIRGARANAAKE